MSETPLLDAVSEKILVKGIQKPFKCVPARDVFQADFRGFFVFDAREPAVSFERVLEVVKEENTITLKSLMENFLYSFYLYDANEKELRDSPGCLGFISSSEGKVVCASEDVLILSDVLQDFHQDEPSEESGLYNYGSYFGIDLPNFGDKRLLVLKDEIQPVLENLDEVRSSSDLPKLLEHSERYKISLLILDLEKSEMAFVSRDATGDFFQPLSYQEAKELVKVCSLLEDLSK